MESNARDFSSRWAPLLALALAWLVPATAHGAIFNVNHTADTVDVNPGDGICDDGGAGCRCRPRD